MWEQCDHVVLDENIEYTIEDARGATEENQALVTTADILIELRDCMNRYGIKDESLMLDMYNEAGQIEDNIVKRLDMTVQLYYTRLEIDAELAKNPAPARGEGEEEERVSGVASRLRDRGKSVHGETGGGSGVQSTKKRKSGQ